MKRRILTILVCLLVTINLFAFSACGYVEGMFYSLEEAYEMGLLTKDDLLSIAYYHNDGREGNEELMPEDYTPQPKMPDTLSESVRYSIKKTYQNEYEVHFNTINLYDYFGTYNELVAVSIYGRLLGGYNEPLYYREYKIGNVMFISYSPNLVRLWVEKK